MTTPKQPEDVQYRVDCAIEAIKEAKTELEAAVIKAEAKGRISELRYSKMIEHHHFKPMDEALDKALVDWQWANPTPSPWAEDEE